MTSARSAILSTVIFVMNTSPPFARNMLAMTFENAIIKKYWPAEDKNPDGDIIPLLHIQIEAELDNSLQVGGEP